MKYIPYRPHLMIGFLLDGGVHQAALLRTVLPTLPERIISTANLHRTHLLPHDTVQAIALPPSSSATDPHGPPTALKRDRTEAPVPNGKSAPAGTILMTFGSSNIPFESKRPSGLFVTTLNGAVHVMKEGKNFVAKVIGAKGSEVKDDQQSGPEQGVEIELKHFAGAIAGEKDVPDYGDVRGALWDLSLIEALLTSEGRELNLGEMMA